MLNLLDASCALYTAEAGGSTSISGFGAVLSVDCQRMTARLFAPSTPRHARNRVSQATVVTAATATTATVTTTAANTAAANTAAANTAAIATTTTLPPPPPPQGQQR